MHFDCLAQMPIFNNPPLNWAVALGTTPGLLLSLIVLRIVHGAKADGVEAISQLIRAIVEAQPDTRFDRCHFARYGASSLDREDVCYVLSPDYNKYRDVQQAISLRIYREFAQRGIDFALPTQTLCLTHAQLESRQELRNAATAPPQN